MMIFYRFTIVPIGTLLLPILALFLPKVRAGLRARLKPLEHPNFHTRPIWIHASSGEFEYAKPLIREVKSQFPQIPIVVTYFSPTYVRSVEKFEGVDWHAPLPLDLPGPCASFVKKINPRIMLLARTDFWPEMLYQCRRYKIPTLVFAYTQKELRNVFSKLLTRWRLSLVDEIGCVSSSDQDQLRNIGITDHVTVLGDPRFDQVYHRLSQPPKIQKPKVKHPLFIAGSTWPEDETVVVPALVPSLRTGRTQMVIVPHEPTPNRIKQITDWLAAHHLSHQRWTDCEGNFDKDVLIFDKVGHLAEVYSWGELAFVGGSFKAQVHSVMEALGAGAITIVGPYHNNNREALEFRAMNFHGHPGLQVALSISQLETDVRYWTEHDEERKLLLKDLRIAFKDRLGGSLRTLQHLLPLISETAFHDGSRPMDPNPP